MAAENELAFQFLAENSTDLICRTGPDQVLTYASPSFFHLLGWKPEEMIGKRLDGFVPVEGISAISAGTLHGLSSRPESSPASVRTRKKDGSIAWLKIKHQLLPDAATGKSRETVFVMHYVAERKAWHEKFSALIPIDSLTGLCNHRVFDELLVREWNRAIRESSHISLLLLDFHHFHYLHTRQGHVEGDCCLEKTAAAVLGALRTTDIAAHYAKEDIALILPATGHGGAARVAEKMRLAIRVLRVPRSTHTKSPSGTDVSIGIATVSGRPEATTNMPALLVLAADLALRRARTIHAKK